jgi:hypothetical protein
MELLSHLLVDVVTVDLDQPGGKLLGCDFVLGDLQVEFALSYIAAVASGIDKAKSVTLDYRRTMVMGADKEVHSMKGLHEVKTLTLKLGSVTAAGG